MPIKYEASQNTQQLSYKIDQATSKIGKATVSTIMPLIMFG